MIHTPSYRLPFSIVFFRHCEETKQSEKNISNLHNFTISQFSNFKISKFQNFQVSKFPISQFPNFKNMIHFTLTEKINFLKSRGYTIGKNTVEFNEHIHGSRFHTYTQAVYMATKPGQRAVELKHAFQIELKKKLLTE